LREERRDTNRSSYTRSKRRTVNHLIRETIIYPHIHRGRKRGRNHTKACIHSTHNEERRVLYSSRKKMRGWGIF
jgi:hypothetical protein